MRRVAVSRFARTLGTLSASNIQIVESMKIVRDTLGNEALARHLDEATAGIVRGSAIADELRDTGQFPQLLIQVIAMGERTGRLDQLLMQTADAYDKETATALQRVMSIVPVVFIPHPGGLRRLHPRRGAAADAERWTCRRRGDSGWRLACWQLAISQNKTMRE